MKKRIIYLLIVIIIIAGLAVVLKSRDVWKNFNNRIEHLISESVYNNADWKENHIKISIDGQEIALNTNKSSSPLELPSLTTEHEVSVKFTFSDIYEIEMDGIPVTNSNPFEYKVSCISQDYFIPINILNTITKDEKKFLIRTYPAAMPTYTVVGESSYSGYYYLTPLLSSGGVIYKIDMNGNLVFYKYSPDVGYWDFKQVNTIDGIRYIYCQEVHSQHTPKAYTTAVEYVILDENYHELKRLRMEKSEKITDDYWPTDQHDMLYISDSEYYLMAYVSRNVKNIPDEIPHKEPDALVVATVIQGFKNGELFFEWDSSDYAELYEASREYNDFTNVTELPADYIHINSIDLDPKDNNIIASFRNFDSVYKIDTETGEILWKLGGKDDSFNLTDDQKTSRQHYARYNANGSITVFDNGNEKRQTRVVEYWLNEENKTVEKFRKYQVDGYYSWATGSAQRIDNENDVFMVGWGVRAETSMKQQPNFSEIDFTNNKTLFEFRFNDNTIQTYRCVKYPQ